MQRTDAHDLATIYEECVLRRTVGVAGSAPGGCWVSSCPTSWLCPSVAEQLSGGGLWASLRGPGGLERLSVY